MGDMGGYSMFLFARPSLVEGGARILDFGDTLNEYNRSMTPEQADQIAIACDWHRVGLDIAEGIRHCSRKRERP